MLCFGQRVDPSNGLVMPWYTHGALDHISEWDVSGARVLEWGGGDSSAWWAAVAREVVTIERKPWWTRSAPNLTIVMHEDIKDGDMDRVAEYVTPPAGYDPDIMIVDDIFRFECIKYALSLPRTHQRILIVDNWQQDYIFDCPEAENFLAPWPGYVYKQPDHTDHIGKPWQTGIWIIDPDWDVTGPYNSHRGALKAALDHTGGTVLELGCGYGSTVSLFDACKAADRKFISLETNEQWAGRFKAMTQVVKNYYPFAETPCDVLFVDCAPGDIRKDMIRMAAQTAKIIVVHDTEAGAEYVYGLSSVLREFKYRIDYENEELPRTTVVSNYINLTQWITPPSSLNGSSPDPLSVSMP